MKRASESTGAMWFCFSVTAGFLPSPVQSCPLHPPAVVFHHHLQHGQALPEEQAAPESESVWSVGPNRNRALGTRRAGCSGTGARSIPPPDPVLWFRAGGSLAVQTWRTVEKGLAFCSALLLGARLPSCLPCFLAGVCPWRRPLWLLPGD